MKKLLLLALAACIPFSMAVAQDPANFHVLYGNPDGSPMSVGLDRDIDVPIWYSTDPTPGNPDSVTFTHTALKTDELIATFMARQTGPNPGDTTFGYFVGQAAGWDDISFRPLNNNGNDPLIPVGFSSRSILGFAYLQDPRSPENFIYTLGGNVLVGYYFMHTASDPALIGTTQCPFSAGHNPANGFDTWGFQDGVRGVVPTGVYGCLYFSPNADPLWTVFPGAAINAILGFPVAVHLEGTDVDDANDLRITQTAGPGLFTETAGGPGGLAAGDWNWTADAIGTFTVGFELSDGMVVLPITFDVVVGLGTLDNASLYIDCPIAAFPGEDVAVPVKMFNEAFVGGFEVLVSADPTALQMLSITPMARIDGGSEYWNVHNYGGGLSRVVYIANINNGIPHDPIMPGDGGIFFITFHVSDALPWGMNIDVTFPIPHFTDNTISDETGYIFRRPNLYDGCVQTYDPNYFKGDPNMNGFFYEIADAVVVARRIIEGYGVWIINPPVQEGASDLNNNGYADISDLVWFINIINDYVLPPKMDPVSGQTLISVDNGTVSINSNSEIGGALVRINHTGEIGTPVAANGMDILTQDVNGVLSVLIYSMEGNRIAAGQQILFSLPTSGEISVSEVQVSDAYGRLLDASAHVGAPLPTSYSVAQNYPNPFNAKTQISFALPTAGDVSVNIYSITGQLVETLGGHFDAGMQSVTWDASNVASGVYFYKVSAGEFNQTMKMTLLK